MFKVLKHFQNSTHLLLLFIITIIFYLPALLNPSLLLERQNDLQEFFWPIFYYTKDNIISNQTLPLWNTLFLSGTPLLPDPQSFLFYIPNVIVLFFPLEKFFLISFILHTFIGSIGFYLLGRRGLNFSKTASLFIASLYIFSPKSAGFLEAGHFGLVAAMTWLPYILLSLVNIIKKPNLLWAILFAATSAQVYYTHTVTFVIITVASIVTFFSGLYLVNTKKLKQSLALFILGGILIFGLIAVTAIPQFEWTPHTTRSLLLSSKETHPQWSSVKEVLQNLFYLWNLKDGSLGKIETEKWISLGIFPLILALIGFLKLKRKLQIILGVSSIIIALIILNNISPFYSFLLSSDLFKLIRVSTRFWIIPLFIVTILSGFTINYFLKSKFDKKIITTLMLFSLAESLILSWAYLLKPVLPQKQFVPQEVYQFLEDDSSLYRIFCVNRCIPQKEAALNHLQLVEGYSTLQQMNYFKHSWQLSGGYWSYYTLSIPPIGLYTFEKPQPDSQALGEYNVKYVISPYELTGSSWLLKKKFENYLLYKNNDLMPRAYFKTTLKGDVKAPVITYSPNHIKVDTSSHLSNQIILAEVYSPGWKAYLNGKIEVPVEETPTSLRLVKIYSATDFVDFRYEPQSFKIGAAITTLTLLAIGMLLIRRYRSDSNKSH